MTLKMGHIVKITVRGYYPLSEVYPAVRGHYPAIMP